MELHKRDLEALSGIVDANKKAISIEFSEADFDEVVYTYGGQSYSYYCKSKSTPVSGSNEDLIGLGEGHRLIITAKGAQGREVLSAIEMLGRIS